MSYLNQHQESLSTKSLQRYGLPLSKLEVHLSGGRAYCLLERCYKAYTVFARMRGLLGTDRLADGEGLWIEPCSSVHTFGMRYPIDVVFVSASGRVLRVLRSMKKNRLHLPVFGATAAVEMASGRASDIREGDSLCLKS